MKSIKEFGDPEDNECGQCKCGAPGTYDHVCPFDADVYNNPTSECNCCSKCRSNCADDI